MIKRATEGLSKPKPPAPVAVVVDPVSAATLSDHHFISDIDPWVQILALSDADFPYEVWSMREIGDPRLRDRRVIVFANAYRLDEAQREAIDALKSDGRLLVFSYAAGAMRPLRGVDGRDMRSLTGLAVVPIKGGEPIECRVLPGIEPWTSGLEKEVEQGPTLALDPWFCVIDTNADALGFIRSKKRLVGVAARDFGDWKVVYSASPFIDARVFETILRAAGIR